MYLRLSALEDLAAPSDRVLVPIDGFPRYGGPLRHRWEYSDADIVASHVIDPFEPGYDVYDIPADVDQIVTGSHGREVDARILLGNVAESVAFRALVRISPIR